MFSALKLFTVANLLTAHLFINTVKKKPQLSCYTLTLTAPQFL